MGTLTIRIDDELEKSLEKAAKTLGKTKSAVAREMLRKNLLVSEFDLIRGQLAPLAEKAGWLTDEDVFRELS